MWKPEGIHPTKALNSAHREAISVLRREFPHGCSVLDIGCGTGHFLLAHRGLGFRVFGVDATRQVVDVLRKQGLEVVLGTVGTLPEDWVDPQVCTSLFTLHHMANPVEFVSSVRERFPKSVLILAEYNNLDGLRHRVDVERGLPPRAYSWWGRDQLRMAMEKAGYRVATAHVPM